MSITLQLHEAVTFHDGTPFNADAVTFIYDSIQDPATGSMVAVDQIGPNKDSDVHGPLEIRINCTRPFPIAPNTLVQASLSPVSRTAVETMGNTAFGQASVGTGLFKFESWEKGKDVIPERNPEDTWAPEFFGMADAACGPLATTTPSYRDGVEDSYPYDPESAAAMLDGAGWTMGDDGIREKDGEPLSIHYLSMLAQAASADSVEERDARDQDIQKLIMDEAIYMAAHNQIQTIVYSSAITGVRFAPGNWQVTCTPSKRRNDPRVRAGHRMMPPARTRLTETVAAQSALHAPPARPHQQEAARCAP